MSFDPRDAFIGGVTSDCCGASVLMGGLCEACREHCESVDDDGPTDAQLHQSTERHWQEKERYRADLIDAGRGRLLGP